jgi:uncharacterized membrane protein YkvA (DUF1232 family)
LPNARVAITGAGMKTLRSMIHDLRIDVHAVWLCARDANVPLGVRLFGLTVAAYALSPIDLIPDFIPVLGLIDDAILVPLGIWLFVKMVPPAIFAQHRADAEMASHRPTSVAGAAAIILIWLAIAAWLGSLLYSARYY